MSMDINTGGYWCKRIFPQYKFGRASFQVDANGDSYILNGAKSSETSMPDFYPEKGMVELYKLDANGNTIWKNGFVFLEEALGDTFRIWPQEIAINAANQLFITGGLSIGGNGGLPDLPLLQFIAKLDAMGNPLAWKMVKGYFPQNMVVTNDGIYLLDKMYYNPWNSFWGGEEYALVVKLDHDLNLVWAKKYFAENFPFSNANLIKSEDGRLLLTSVTFGSFPAILTEIGPDGNIVQQKGYPNFQPQTKFMNDGSLLMASGYKVDNSGNLSEFPTIAKTDPDGYIEGCPTFPACLTVSDTTVEMTSFHIEPHAVLDLEDVVLEVEPFEVSFTDFSCSDYPPLPVPSFTFPDTLCVGGAATSISDGNRLAQEREWQLTGPNGVDSILKDDILVPFDSAYEFAYQFTVPGEYLLRQSIWVLGCRYDYERSIAVVPVLSVAITTDSLICPDEPQEIVAVANGAATYAWNDGRTGATIPVTASGTYAVTATNGGCTASDTASVTVVAELLGGSPPFTLPPDTNICNVDLPFLLVPQSLFTEVFTLGNDPAPAATFSLTEAGTYKVGMEAFGCGFEQPFRLVTDCQAKVYVPNSFSPNSDGINDVFQPYGTDFEVLELSIFDRWGGLVHQSEGLAAGWDGGKATQGVYAYLLVYHDLLSLSTETLKGDVVLLQ